MSNQTDKPEGNPLMIPEPSEMDPVLQHEWMVVATSAELTDAPLRVRVLGRDIVLWRSLSGISAFRDLCIHRGTALSLGRIADNTLVCPYHGWRYDASGQCVSIPAQPELAIPTKAKAERYHVSEHYGLIWVCIGEPVADVPHYEELEGFKTIICGPYTVEAEPPRVIENFLDVSHLMWVHEGYLGVPSHAEIPEYHVHEKEGKLVSDTIHVYQPDPDGRGKDLSNNYIYKVLRPLTAYFRKSDDDSDDVFAMMLHATPNGPRQTTAYALLSRNYGFDMPDDTFRNFQDTIFAQDERILLSQRPEDLPLDLAAELHIKSDRLAIAYRKYLRALGIQTGVA